MLRTKGWPGAARNLIPSGLPVSSFSCIAWALHSCSSLFMLFCYSYPLMDFL